jgi:hypothetical protein
VVIATSNTRQEFTMPRIYLLIAAIATLTAGGAAAQTPAPNGGFAPMLPPVSSPSAPSGGITSAPRTATTSGGSGLLTGNGNNPNVMIPGSPVPGTLYNNGNGTSSVIIPGAPSEVIPTPR